MFPLGRSQNRKKEEPEGTDGNQMFPLGRPQSRAEETFDSRPSYAILISKKVSVSFIFLCSILLQQMAVSRGHPPYNSFINRKSFNL